MTGMPTPLDVVSKVLGRTPTPQEMIDLAPVAIMVESFCARGEDGDQLTLQVEQWNNSFLFGLYDNQGQKMELKITKGDGE